jgi:hypothetical protein
MDAIPAFPLRVDESYIFPTNRLVWFRENIKKSLEFRKLYISPELQAIIESDESFKSKDRIDQKILVVCTFAWNYIKINNKELSEKMQEYYQISKLTYNLYSTKIKPCCNGILTMMKDLCNKNEGDLTLISKDGDVKCHKMFF